MSILVTGAAGFIGFYVTQALLARGEHVKRLDARHRLRTKHDD